MGVVKRLLVVIGLLFAFNANSQVLTNPNVYGYQFRRLVTDSLFALPTDTFNVPVSLRTYPFIARKGTTLYLWNTSTFAWGAFSGGGGGGWGYSDTVATLTGSSTVDANRNTFKISNMGTASDFSPFAEGSSLNFGAINDWGDVIIMADSIRFPLQYNSTASDTSLVKPLVIAPSGKISRLISWSLIGGGTPAGSNKQVQYNSSGSFAGAAGVEIGNTNNRLYLQGQATTEVPLIIQAVSSQSADLFQFKNSSGTNLVSIGVGGQVVSVQNITAFSGGSERVQIGYTNLGSASVAFGASSDTYLYKLSAGRLRIFNGSTDGDLTARSATWSGRVLLAQGADVASANNITLGSDGNTFEITGTTQVNLIANTNWQNGSEVTLLLASGITVKHGQTTSGSNITISLSGAADLVTAAETALTLVLSEVGGTQKWREKHRVSY